MSQIKRGRVKFFPRTNCYMRQKQGNKKHPLGKVGRLKGTKLNSGTKLNPSTLNK